MQSSLGFPSESMHSEHESRHFEASEAIQDSQGFMEAATAEEGRRMLQGIVAIQAITNVRDGTIDVRDATVLAQINGAVDFMMKHPDLGVHFRQSHAFKQAMSIGIKIIYFCTINSLF